MNLLDDSLMPLDNPAEVDHSFRYHPLLQGTPVPNYSNLVPNYSELGRISVHHDNQGLRGFERSAALLKQQIVIATLGGSSTYDIGVPNGKTWSDFLEQKLGHEYAVLNHGVPGYSSVENLIQTIFYLNAYNIRPRCAVYYLGWNDIRNAHLPHLDPAYADFHLLTQSNSLGVRGRRSSNTLPYVSNISPLAGVLITYLQMSFDTVPLPESFVHKDPVSGTDGRLEIIFRANVQAIAAINKERKITSIFVGQIFNRPLLTTPSRPGWFPLLRNMDIWPLQDPFNHILKDTAEAVGSLWIIPPVDEFQNADFVDKGHFSPRGSEKFASILAPLVRANCKN